MGDQNLQVIAAMFKIRRWLKKDQPNPYDLDALNCYRATEFFPACFRHFGAVPSVNFYCGGCRASLHHDDVKLLHTIHAEYDEIDAIGACHSCQLETPYLFRFRSENVVEQMQGSRWRRFTLRPPH